METTLSFTRFNSLENSYQQKLVDKVVYEGRDGGLWVATEKLHGANFSFWCDGSEVKVASRTQFVDGTFFNCQAVINKHSASILEYHQKNFVPGAVLVVYGELYGANIQKEVQYGERRFSGFEVVINRTPLRKDEAFGMLAGMGICSAPVKFVGSFADCMAFNHTFRSEETPVDFPADEENYAEGLVIEPMIPQWFNNGSRIYFKNKTPAFTEKKHKTPKVPQTSSPFTPEVQDAYDTLMSYATEARVRNVLSKIGTITNKDFPRVVGLFVQDMMEDCEKEEGIELKIVAGDVWKQFAASVNRESIVIARPVILEFIE